MVIDDRMCLRICFSPVGLPLVGGWAGNVHRLKARRLPGVSMRARDAEQYCGSLPFGEHNSIADVPGVAVGHATLAERDIRTGVTAVLPHDGDLFRDKVVASA
jgi:hypothetical protein